MQIQNINNQYKQNFGAFCLQPKEKTVTPIFENLAKHYIQGFGFVTQKGLTRKGDEVLLITSSFKYKPSVAEHITARFRKHSSAVVKEISDKDAKKYINRYERKNKAKPSILSNIKEIWNSYFKKSA